MTGHPPATEIHDWLDGDVDAERAQKIATHLANCAFCRREHAALIETDRLLRAMTTEASELRRPVRRGLVAAALAAALLVALVVPRSTRTARPEPAPTHAGERPVGRLLELRVRDERPIPGGRSERRWSFTETEGWRRSESLTIADETFEFHSRN